jgi:hypothetical protein
MGDPGLLRANEHCGKVIMELMAVNMGMGVDQKCVLGHLFISSYCYQDGGLPVILL